MCFENVWKVSRQVSVRSVSGQCFVGRFCGVCFDLSALWASCPSLVPGGFAERSLRCVSLVALLGFCEKKCPSVSDRRQVLSGSSVY